MIVETNKNFFILVSIKQLVDFYKEVKDAFKELFADEKVGSTSKGSHPSKGSDMSY